MGSNGHDLVGDLWIHLLSLKVLKAGGTESGALLNEPEAGNVSLILLILLVKRENVFARLFSEE